MIASFLSLKVVSQFPHRFQLLLQDLSYASIPKYRIHSEVPNPPCFFLVTWSISAFRSTASIRPFSSSLLEAYRQANLGDVILSSLLTSFLAFRRHRPFFIMSFANLCLSVMPPDPKLTDPLQPLPDYQSLCQRQPSIFNLPPTFLGNAPCLCLPAFIRLSMWNL